MEDGVIHECISVVGDIDYEEPVIISELMADSTHTSYSGDLGNLSHCMVVHIQGVMRDCRCEIVPPILPYRGVVDITSAIDEYILTSEHQFHMSRIVMGMSAFLSLDGTYGFYLY